MTISAFTKIAVWLVAFNVQNICAQNYSRANEYATITIPFPGGSSIVTDIVASGNDVYVSARPASSTTTSEFAMSSDGGLTFSFNSNINGLVENISCIFAKNKQIYLGTDRGLFISNNGGLTFEMNSAFKKGDVHEVQVFGLTIYALIDGNLWVSRNAGKSASQHVDRRLSGLNYLCASSIYKHVCVSAKNGVFVSSDYGLTFKLKVFEEDSLKLTLYGVHVSESGTVYIAAGRHGLYTASDTDCYFKNNRNPGSAYNLTGNGDCIFLLGAPDFNYALTLYGMRENGQNFSLYHRFENVNIMHQGNNRLFIGYELPGVNSTKISIINLKHR